MERKRSIGVTLLGLGVLIIGALTILFCFLVLFYVPFRIKEISQFNSLSLKEFAALIIPFISKSNLIDISLSLAYRFLAGLIFFICGFGILRLRNWARRLLLIYVSLNLVFNVIASVFYSGFLIAHKDHGLIKAIASGLASHLLAILLIYLLTRPKIKEQFK